MEIQYRHQLPLLLKHFNLQPTAIELGVAQGNFSHELLSNGIEFLYCVDAWKTIENGHYDAEYPQEWHNENLGITIDRLSPFLGKFKLLKGLTNVMHTSIPNNSVSLLYLDAGHLKNDVKQDLDNYYPKIVDTGIISGHDIHLEGVREAVEEFCKTNNKKLNIIPETDPTNSSFWFRK